MGGAIELQIDISLNCKVRLDLLKCNSESFSLGLYDKDKSRGNGEDGERL